jgi:hypothetical protein
LDRINEAKSDFQIALELAQQQENDNLKAFVEKCLRELNDFTLQDGSKESTVNQATSKRRNKKPRRDD